MEVFMKVLMIENDLRLAAVICDVLLFQKHQVSIDSDEAGLQKKLKKQDFDMMIWDASYEGAEYDLTLKQIKEQNPSLTVVAITEEMTLDKRIRILDAGADYCLEKSFDVRALLMCIQGISRKKRWEYNWNYHSRHQRAAAC
jgi:DNA-binding response OmpR family regulator